MNPNNLIIKQLKDGRWAVLQILDTNVTEIIGVWKTQGAARCDRASLICFYEEEVDGKS